MRRCPQPLRGSAAVPGLAVTHTASMAVRMRFSSARCALGVAKSKAETCTRCTGTCSACTVGDIANEMAASSVRPAAVKRVVRPGRVWRFMAGSLVEVDAGQCCRAQFFGHLQVLNTCSTPAEGCSCILPGSLGAEWSHENRGEVRRGPARGDGPVGTRPAQKRPSRLPLAALRVFAVCRAAQLQGAAESLNLSTAAVSMQVKALEDYLQVKLLLTKLAQRRASSPPKASGWCPSSSAGLTSWSRVSGTVRASRSGGVLVLSVLSSFLHSWLTSRLPDLFGRGIRKSTCASSVHRSSRTSRDRMCMWPCAWAGAAGPGCMSRNCSDEYRVPLCSPELLARHGKLAGPVSLAPIRCCTRVPSRGRCGSIACSGLSIPLPRSAGPSVERLSRQRGHTPAAPHGQGLVLSRWSLAQPFLATGQLVRASDVAAHPLGFDCYFVCPPAYLEMEKVQAFRRWLLEHSATMPVPERVKEPERVHARFTALPVAGRRRCPAHEPWPRGADPARPQCIDPSIAAVRLHFPPRARRPEGAGRDAAADRQAMCRPAGLLAPGCRVGKMNVTGSRVGDSRRSGFFA